MKKLLMILAIFSLNFLDKTAHADGHVEKVWETEKILEEEISKDKHEKIIVEAAKKI